MCKEVCRGGKEVWAGIFRFSKICAYRAHASSVQGGDSGGCRELCAEEGGRGDGRLGGGSAGGAPDGLPPRRLHMAPLYLLPGTLTLFCVSLFRPHGFPEIGWNPTPP